MPIIFFFCGIFVWFWYRGNCDLIDFEFGSVPSSAVFWNSFRIGVSSSLKASSLELLFVGSFLVLVFCLFVLLFRAAPMAYGGSQARGRIRDTAPSQRHSHAKQDPSCLCYLHHSSWQHQILNPLREARD